MTGTEIGAIMAGIAALASLFKKNKSTVTTTEPAKGFQDPSLGFMSPMVIQSLLANLKRYQGAGWPGGAGLGGQNSGMMNDIMALFKKDWPNIMSQYNQNPLFGVQSRTTPAKPTGSGWGML
uniref:Uncharacterized protein n=1 Tax=viral metagenome TaxID=1070528 RepID=A0A6M3X6Y7_9ZZZZ